MADKTANMAIHNPVFTANIVSRCKICNVLGIEIVPWWHVKRRLHAYPTNPVAVHWQKSKTIIAIVISASTVAPTTRFKRVMHCSPMLDHRFGGEKYSYHEERVTNLSEWDDVYTPGSKWWTYTSKLHTREENEQTHSHYRTLCYMD